MKNTKRYLLFFWGVWVLSSAIFSQSINGEQENAAHKILSEKPKHTIAVLWGSNYYGNTFGLSYNRWIHRHFSVGVNLAFGGVNYTLPANSTEFNISYSGNNDLINNIKIHYVFNTSIYWHRKQNKRFIFFNTFGIGAGRYSITLTQSTVEKNIPGVFEGSENMSRFALFLTTHILEYRQKKIPFFGITLGAKANLSHMKLPESFILRNSPFYKTITLDGSGYYMIPYLEGFLRFSISF